MKKKPNDVEVCMGGDKPIPIQVLDTHITEIAIGFRTMLNSGLKKKTIILLVQDATKVNKTDIEKILDALPRLGEIYTEKRK